MVISGFILFGESTPVMENRMEKKIGNWDCSGSSSSKGYITFASILGFPVSQNRPKA